MKKKQLCSYCIRPQPERSAGGYRENPFCGWCLNERCLEHVEAAGVAAFVEPEVAEKLRELRYLMEHATEEDRHKLPEMTQWFETYLTQATPAERTAVRQAVRRLWPVGAMVLIEEAESEDLEVATGAKLALEKMRALREGGKN